MRYGMKNNRRIATALLLFTLNFSFATAQAADIPLLTWEKGKAQSVVLGGENANDDWKVFLKSSDSQALELSPSLSNKAGFVVYSITVPRDIAPGAYSVVTKGPESPERLVAAVEIIEMKRYEITRVPGDLLFFLLSMALWLSALAALRGEEFRRVTFYTSTGLKERYLAGEPAEGYIEHVHRLNRFEKVRIKIYEQIPDSFFKFLLKSDSRGIHLEFPLLWSILPGIAILISVILGYSTRNTVELEFYGSHLGLLLAIALIGSLDIYSGILGAFAFLAVKIWLLSEFSVSSVAATLVISLLFFLPALLSVYFTTLTTGANHSRVHQTATLLVFQWVAPLALLHTIVLIHRSITGSTQSTVGIEALLAAIVLGGRQIEGYLSNNGIKWRNQVRMVEEFEVRIGRLISPSFTAAILIVLSVIFYSWTLTLSTSIYLALALTLPAFLLILRPTRLRIGFFTKIRRNYLFEIAIVVALTFIIFLGLQRLPFVAGSSAFALILFGFSPVFVHALISFLSDLSQSDESEALN